MGGKGGKVGTQLTGSGGSNSVGVFLYVSLVKENTMTFSELWHDCKSFSNLFLLFPLNSSFIFMVVVMVVGWEGSFWCSKRVFRILSVHQPAEINYIILGYLISC